MDKRAQALLKPSRLYRGPIARGIASGATGIDPHGGAYSAGLIRGAAILTRGEAVGHDEWVDRRMLSDVASAINATGGGIKSRFTHPDLSGDGLGKALGRFRDARRDDDVVRADLHIYAAAHDAPDGDLAQYVMNLAREDSAAFGTSIAFTPDASAMNSFTMLHRRDDGAFHSPDADNEHNYPHVRLASLEAIDTVDEPAANPDGLFHRGDGIAAEAEAVLDYALGLSDAAPDETMFNVAPLRIRAFVARYMMRKHLTITHESPALRRMFAAELDEFLAAQQ